VLLHLYLLPLPANNIHAIRLKIPTVTSMFSGSQKSMKLFAESELLEIQDGNQCTRRQQETARYDCCAKESFHQNKYKFGKIDPDYI